jgi:hypothetical protein
MLDATAGDCFDGILTGAGPGGPVRADCRTATAKVTKTLPRVAALACTEAPRTYPQPPPGRTVCLVSN